MNFVGVLYFCAALSGPPDPHACAEHHDKELAVPGEFANPMECGRNAVQYIIKQDLKAHLKENEFIVISCKPSDPPA